MQKNLKKIPFPPFISSLLTFVNLQATGGDDSEDDLPPPQYEESMAAAASTVMVPAPATALGGDSLAAQGAAALPKA